MTDSAAFWNRAAPKYAKSKIKDMGAYETTLERTRDHLRHDHKVLEIGCGTGSTALILAPDVAAYTGTDVSEAMIGIARDKAWERSIPGLTFATSGADALTVTEAPDVVLAFNLIHLLPDPPATLARVFDTLPPGGLFISKTVCLGERMGYLKPLIWGMRKVGLAPRDVQFFKVAQLDAMVRDAGFEIVETGNYPDKTPSRFIVARKPG